MTERKLATIRRISNIEPIEGADAIEVATVGGWKVVVKKNEFEVGQLVTYIEIDSWVPHDIAPFLSKGKEPRVYEGIKGERLRTVKFKKQLSQGLILKIDDCFDIIEIDGKKYINASEHHKTSRTEDVYIQNNKQNQ